LQESADEEAVRAAKTARDEYYTHLAKIGVKTEQNGDPAVQAQEIENLQVRVVEAENKVRASSQVYRSLIGKSLDTDAKNWSPQIAPGDLALVYYVGSERSYVFVCGEKLGIEAYRLELTADRAQPLGLREPSNNGKRPLRSDDIARLVEQVTALTLKPGERSRGADLQVVTSQKIEPLEANELHRVTDLLVLPAVRARLAELKPRHLLIVPDGPLHQLAFESLPTDPRISAYLLDELPPVCYAPSLEIYQQLQTKTDGTTPELHLLSVADPSYPDSTGESRDATVADDFLRLLGRPLLSRLPETKVESNDVLKSFPGSHQLIENDATEANLKLGLADSARYLHVAAHGLVDQRHNNLFGALALTPPKTPTANDDGFLTLYEAMQLPLKGCELAVLSACETNCGPENKLEAGSTMARAFFCAGARRVVCSHWQVSDEATAKLIAQFMQNVAADRAWGEVNYAVALHDAKKQLRSQSSTAEPYYWAPFVLQGRPTSDQVNGERAPLAVNRD
jgi:CHAT domain-containing protein